MVQKFYNAHITFIYTNTKQKTLMGTSSEGQNQLRHTLKPSHSFILSQQGWNFINQSSSLLPDYNITYNATLVGLACLQALECCTKPCEL